MLKAGFGLLLSDAILVEMLQEVGGVDEIDARGRQMLIERPALSKGRLSVFRESYDRDPYFPHLKMTVKKAGTDSVLWRWQSHHHPPDVDEPPPYGDEVMLEKYFELNFPIKTPRGLESILWLGPGLTSSARVEIFSVAIYLYPHSLEERGIQICVLDFPGGLAASSTPVYMRVNFPW